MAEEKAKSTEAAAAPAAPTGQKPVMLIVLVLINMAVVLGVGFMVWKSKQTPPPTIDQIVAGEKQQSEADKTFTEEVGKVIPLETFIVNLANSKGRKVLKVNMELEVTGSDIVQEVDNRKAQIRDFIIIILSVKTYEQISTKEGKDDLRTEIKDKVNSFLSKGKITNVYFTELIYN